jgi:hypothetical protein
MGDFPLLDHSVSVVVTYCVNSTWQVPLVLAAAVSAARVLTRLGPWAVHRMWVGALLLAVALPACRLTDWTLPLGRLWQGAMPGGGDVRVTVLPGGAAAGSSLQWAPWLLELLFAAYAVSVLYGGRAPVPCAPEGAANKASRCGLASRRSTAGELGCPARTDDESCCATGRVCEHQRADGAGRSASVVAGADRFLCPRRWCGTQCCARTRTGACAEAGFCQESRVYRARAAGGVAPMPVAGPGACGGESRNGVRCDGC